MHEGHLNTTCWLACSRKTLIYLILTLNHCYPDYDFSLLRAHHFRKEPGVSAVEQAVDSHLLEASRVRPPTCGQRRLLGVRPSAWPCAVPTGGEVSQRWMSG